jgi:hypothetical protein
MAPQLAPGCSISPVARSNSGRRYDGGVARSSHLAQRQYSSQMFCAFVVPTAN